LLVKGNATKQETNLPRAQTMIDVIWALIVCERVISGIVGHCVCPGNCGHRHSHYGCGKELINLAHSSLHQQLPVPNIVSYCCVAGWAQVNPCRLLPKAPIGSLSMNLTSHFDGEEVLAVLGAMK